MLKKILKISAWVILAVFLLVGSLTYAIRLPKFQTWLTAKVTEYLSSELGTTVSVERVYVRFFSKVVLENIFMSDKQGDTLLYAGNLTAEIELFSPKNNKIYLSGIDLSDATIKVIKYKDIPGLNFKFLLDYFSSTDTTPSTPFDFNPGEIRLKNVSFCYQDKRYQDPSRGIDFEDIRLDGLQATLGNISQQADTLVLDIDHLSFTEKSGFRLEYLESNVKCTPFYTDFENLLINTETSNIQCNFSMNYEEAADFEDYINKVRMTSQFEESTLSSKDLIYFAPDLLGMDQEIVFNGKVKGTVAQLRGKDLEINFANASRFRGDISLTGLPDIDETFFDLVVMELVTHKSDIETLPTYPFTDKGMVELPDNFIMLGTVNINGKFTGFLNDFVAYGNANTALGYISSDLNLKMDTDAEKSSYSGHLSAIGFEVGKLTKTETILGKVSFKSKVKGSGLSLDKVDARMEGLISELELKGYRYSNISVNGRISKRLFNGFLSVDEPNFAIDFKGEIDLQGKIPEYDFTTTIYRARLAKLNLLQRDSTSNLKLKADINIRGRDIDELTGFVNIQDFEYSEINDTIQLDKISFESERGNNTQMATFRSDLMDFDLTGSYKRTAMIPGTMEVIARYFPLYHDQIAKPAAPIDINLDLKLHDVSDITSIFFTDLTISPGTHFTCHINNTTGLFDAHLKSDSILIGEAKLYQTLLSATSDNKGTLNVKYTTEQLILKDTLDFRNLELNASSGSKTATFNLTAASLDTAQNRIRCSGSAEYLHRRVDLHIDPSELQLGGHLLTTSDKTSISITDTSTIIHALRLGSDENYLDAKGVISSRPEDKLSVELKDFDTQALNPILAMYGFKMGGLASGTGWVAGATSHPGIDADIKISNLSIYGDTLGDATFDFHFDTQAGVIQVNAFADRGGTRNIEMTGSMIVGETDDSLDFEITLKKTNLAAFAGYASSLVSDVRGKASGSLKLTGSLRKPVLKGELRLQQTSFMVDYLQTRYNLSDVVHFDQRMIRFDHIKVNDVNGNQADINGMVYHNHLSDFVLALEINAKNFQALNTTFIDNELFYGTAYVTGKVKINGPLDLIKLNMALKSEKGTLINIPLSNPEEISKSSFITFINTAETVSADEKENNRLTGIDMTMELNATPDAEIRLIFDSKIGDVIKGRGNGNLTMTIDPLGEFNMYGNYQVVSGDYLFTLQNLLNKKFVVSPGSNIRWSGSPYDAEIDLEGVYKLKTSLYDLLQDTAYKKRIPVEVILKLTEKLFNPNIAFSIVVPDVDPTTETLINRYINTEEELNKQTMSLLVLNRFSRASDVENSGTASSSGISANVSEVLSQQLSVWASQISDNFDVGVNYRAADEFSQEELEVALSTNLFNDRVTVDGAVNVSENNENTSNLVGDFNVEVKVSKDGRLRFKAFNKSVENSIVNNYSSQYTQGIGIFYREEFNTFGELFQRFRSHFKKDEEPEEATGKL